MRMFYYLRDTNPVSIINCSSNVLIPNYMVRFGSSKSKPLGIAYADLPQDENFEEILKQLDGITFKERKLLVKKHVPFVPSSPRLLRITGGTLRRRRPKNVSETSEDGIVSSPANGVEGVALPVAAEQADQVSNVGYSESTLFMRGVKHKTSEAEIEQFFAAHHPKLVRIIRPKYFLKSLKSRCYHALVTFDLEEGTNLDGLIAGYKDKLFQGSPVVIMKAYASKPNSPVSPIREVDEDANSISQKSLKSVAGDAVVETVVTISSDGAVVSSQG